MKLYDEIYTAINEALIKSLVIDDDDDDNNVTFKKHKITNSVKGIQKIKMLAEMFSNISGIDIDLDNDFQFYANEKSVNNELHAIGVILYDDQKNMDTRYCMHTWIFDINMISEELTIGVLGYLPRETQYLSISKPMVDFISNCNEDIYVASYATENGLYGASLEHLKDGAKELFNELYLPSDKPQYGKIITAVSFFNPMKLNGKWYSKLPTNNSNMNGFRNFPDEFKLPDNFINNFKGVRNESAVFKGMSDGKESTAKINLYTCMFNDNSGFAKIAEMFINKGYTVIDEYNVQYNKDNYKELLHDDLIKSKQTKYDNIKKEQNDDIDKIENESKEIIKKYIGEKACDNFEYLNNNDYTQYKLSVYDLVRERAGKDIYRKFDEPVILEFLKNNGINFNEILNESFNKVKEYAKELIELYKKDTKNMTDDEISALNTGASNWERASYRYNLFYVYLTSQYFKSNDKKNELLDKIQREYIDYSKIHSVKIIYESIEEFNREFIANRDKEEYLINTIFQLRFFKDNNIDRANTILYRRFLILLIKYLYEYDIHEMTNDKISNYDKDNIDIEKALNDWATNVMGYNKYNMNKDAIEPYVLLNNKDILTKNDYYKSESQYISGHGTSTKECRFRLSNYTRLYAFYYCLAKALKNAYNIKIMNPYYYNIAKNTRFNLKKELNDNLEPNIQAINFDAINKMLQTIFTNKIKAINKFANSKIIK